MTTGDSRPPFDKNQSGPTGLLDNASAQARPLVARPPDRYTVPIIVFVSVILGGIVFAYLNANRPRQVVVAPPPPKPATIVVQAPSPAPVAPPIIAPPTPSPQPAPVPVIHDVGQEARWKSPSLIVDLSGNTPVPNAANAAVSGGVPTSPIAQALTPPGARAADTLTPDERFAERLGVAGNNGAARASKIADLSNTVAEGSLVTAVLETGINSDVAGAARAIVSRDVRSFDGKKVLIPRGSHVIGQYRSGLALGQSRVFVVWTRLIRPDGASIDVGSEGTDDVGRGGLAGDVDRHFFQRFGGAMLMSLLGVAGDLLGNSSKNPQVVINSTTSAANAASVALQTEVNRPPTIDVPPGTPLRIFVARDLDFSTIEARQ